MVRIITDSMCDLPEELRARYDITIASYRVTIDGETFVERDELTPAEFWRRMAAARNLPTTTPPTPGELAEIFRAEDDEPQLCITISNKLSATYASALIAADECGGTVTVFDTLHASIGQGLFVLRAAALAQAGATVDEIVADLTAYRDAFTQLNLIYTFDNLVRGGRLTRAQGAVTSVLGIRAVVGFNDGELKVGAKVRGRHKLLETVLGMVAKQSPDLSARRVGLAHLDNAEDVEYLAGQLRERFGARDIVVAQIGAGIGTYSGAGGVVVAL